MRPGEGRYGERPLRRTPRGAAQDRLAAVPKLPGTVFVRSEALKIVLLSLFAAIGYGIAQDQITARVCVEYFTLGHPDLFHTTSPTLLAFGWGVVATWWVGLPMGLLLAVAARTGPPPKRAVAELAGPLLRLLAGVGTCAAFAGLTGYLYARQGHTDLVERLFPAVPPEARARFFADAAAHQTAYVVAFFGAGCLCVSTWVRRRSGWVAPRRHGDT